MTQLTERDLLGLKQKVDEAKSAVSELKGHQQALLKQLNDDWGCKTVGEAEEKLQSMKMDIEQLELSIQEGTVELEEKYINN